MGSFGSWGAVVERVGRREELVIYGSWVSRDGSV